MLGDYRDVVIAEFADSEARLLDRVADLEAERDSYRLVAQQAIHALHDLTVRERQHQERYRRLNDEYRELREQILLNGKSWAA